MQNGILEHISHTEAYCMWLNPELTPKDTN